MWLYPPPGTISTADPLGEDGRKTVSVGIAMPDTARSARLPKKLRSTTEGLSLTPAPPGGVPGQSGTVSGSPDGATAAFNVAVVTAPAAMAARAPIPIAVRLS